MRNVRLWLKRNWSNENPIHLEIFVLFCACVLLVVYFLLPAPTLDRSRWGEFGDFFAGVMNPLISLLILRVAVRVWELQKAELADAKQLLSEQLRSSQQDRLETMFVTLQDRADKHLKEQADAHHKANLIQMADTMHLTDFFIKRINDYGSGFGFSEVFSLRDQAKIDAKLKPVSNGLRQWIQIHSAMLNLLSAKIASQDKSTWQEIYRTGIDRDQITLLCMLSCSSEQKSLRLLLSQCEVYEGLSAPEKAWARDHGWLPHFDEVDL